MKLSDNDSVMISLHFQQLLVSDNTLFSNYLYFQKAIAAEEPKILPLNNAYMFFSYFFKKMLHRCVKKHCFSIPFQCQDRSEA